MLEPGSLSTFSTLRCMRFLRTGASRALEVRFAESKRPQRRRGGAGGGAAEVGEESFGGSHGGNGVGPEKGASSTAVPWEPWLSREARAGGAGGVAGRFGAADCPSTAQTLVSSAAHAQGSASLSPVSPRGRSGDRRIQPRRDRLPASSLGCCAVSVCRD